MHSSTTFLDRSRHPWGQTCLVAVAHALAVWSGARLLATTGTGAIVWPAAGVLVGAFLVWRDTPRWMLAGGACAAAAAVHVALGTSPPLALPLSALGVLESLLIAWALPRWREDIRQFSSVSALFLLGAVSACVAGAVGILGTVAVMLTGTATTTLLHAWVVWTSGHMLGVLLFTPPWLAWSRPRAAWTARRSTARRLEAIAAAVTLLTITMLVFFQDVAGFAPLRLLSLPHQILPVALWIAIRFGTRGTSLAMLAVSLLTVIGTSLDAGAFTLTHPVLADRVLVAQGYVGSLTLGCMALAIAIEQSHAQERQTRLLNVSLAEANGVLTHEIGERERTALSLRMLLDATPEGILVVDIDGRIVEVNAALERMVGYSRMQLLGQPSELLVSDAHRDAAVAYRARFAAAPADVDARRTHHDLTAVRSDGSCFEAEVGLSPYYLGDQLRIIAAIRDVTAERAVERRMETSLREKEVLLREVHHRVKNNMAVMSSLFYLQSRHAADPHTVRVFRESESRVRSMAMVHEVLYRSGDLSAVDFGHYLASLVDHLGNMYRATLPTLRVERDIQTVRLSIEQAVPCGLLLNELLTNVLKHAFVDGEPALLQVSARSRNGEVYIDIVDNGVGMPDDVSPASTQTLGVRLMQALIEQLDGCITHAAQARGTKTAVRFPLVVGTSTPATMPVATPA